MAILDWCVSGSGLPAAEDSQKVLVSQTLRSRHAGPLSENAMASK
jgi:hypothetical protein